MSGRRQAVRLRHQLSDRDLAMLHSLRELRLLTGSQLRRLHFADGDASTQARKTRAAVKRLAELGVVVRLERRIGGVHSGSDGQVIGLTGLGHALLAIEAQPPARHRTVSNHKPAFQDHLLAVNELAVTMFEQARDGTLELLNFQAEPACWRRYSGIGGQPITVKPDAFVRLGVGEYEISAFIEQDQGTESLPTISRKCGVYADYWRSGVEQQRYGVFPLVWWLVPNAARRDAIERAIRRLTAEIQQLFAVALTSEAVTRLSGGVR
jgi:hypothetical protein